MWHCFLTGSCKDINGRQPLKVLHSIEYLTYDLRGGKVEVHGDFFVENLSDKATCLRGLHRGNIEFELKTKSWLKDEHWTQVLRRIAGEYIGLRIEGEEQIFLCRAGADPLPVTLLTGSGKVKEWSPVRPVNGSYACFSGWESPMIEARSCCLFRIGGSIQGETYGRLMEYPKGERIQVMGGEPLEQAIRDDFEEGINREEEYAREYWKFLEEYNDKPRFYHVFIEFADNRTVKLLEISEDMRKRVLNEKIDGRYISWLCSDMDFNIFAKANGPVLVLAAE